MTVVISYPSAFMDTEDPLLRRPKIAENRPKFTANSRKAFKSVSFEKWPPTMAKGSSFMHFAIMEDHFEHANLPNFYHN